MRPERLGLVELVERHDELVGGGDVVPDGGAQRPEVPSRRGERGLDLRDGARFLHTAPHHDDIMLGYLPYIKNRLTPRASVPPDAPGPAADPPGREEGTGDGRQHVFCYCTFGFNSVTNKLMAEILRGCRDGLSVGGALRADAEAQMFEQATAELKDLTQVVVSELEGQLQLQVNMLLGRFRAAPLRASWVARRGSRRRGSRSS